VPSCLSLLRRPARLTQTVGLHRAMTINDPQLKTHVERVVALATGLPEDTRPVCGLLDAYDFYRRAAGADSPQAREALQLLLSEELRPGLWHRYRRCGNDMSPAAVEFRERLSSLAGERFG
jgi:uncharacterized Fe-S cluster-containing protein